MDNHSKRYIKAAAVCERYGGISNMTLWRWLNAPGSTFPRPMYLGRHRLWDVAALDVYDRECAAHCAGGIAA